MAKPFYKVVMGDTVTTVYANKGDKIGTLFVRMGASKLFSWKVSLPRTEKDIPSFQRDVDYIAKGFIDKEGRQ